MDSTIRIIGGKPLSGEIDLRGAKNTISKSMVASLLSDQPSTLKNIAHVEDVKIMSDLITLIGGEVEAIDDSTLRLTTPEIKDVKAKEIEKFSGKSRIPVLLCGPMLARTGRAIIPMPGGCNIGKRPVNFHLQALKELGAEIEEREDHYLIRAEKLIGTKITLPYPSVGATEQVLLSGVLAEGITELHNAAVEPEIMDLIAVLQKMGAVISVDTDRKITIVGVKKMHGYNHVAIPDRLEAASWACAAVVTGGKIFVRGAKQLDLITFLNRFRQIGGEFDITEDGITFFRAGSELNSISLETDVFPGFSTDYQQPFVVALTQASGTSIVHETVYENRFGYVEALNQMGAEIQLYKGCLGGLDCRFAGSNYLHSASISGPQKLHGAEITVPDLRGGFSYVIAALAADGESVIKNFNILNRGYENLIGKLKSLGADVTEIND